MTEPAGSAGRRRRWPWLLAAGLVGALLVAQLLPGGGGPSGERTAPFLLTSQELGAAAGAGFTRTNPPVDLGQVERLAQAAGGVPAPADRSIATWQSPDGRQVTQVVLLFDDPAQAARLDELAVRHLPGAFGLAPREAALPGAQDPRAWSGAGYEALTFRRGGLAVFLGANADEAFLRQLAETLLPRLEAPPAAPTSG